MNNRLASVCVAALVLSVAGCDAATALPVRSTEPDVSHDGGQVDVQAKISSDAMTVDVSQPADSRVQVPDAAADVPSEGAANDAVACAKFTQPCSIPEILCCGALVCGADHLCDAITK
jgi:hypothetical protein